MDERLQQHDELGVDGGIVGADRLGADLPELAEAPGLRLLLAGERPEVPQLHRLGQLVHAVLEVGAADRRGALGAQRHALAPALVERVHLLLDDVGRLADAAGEELGVFEGGRLDAPVARALQDLPRLGLQRGAGRRVVGQHVVRAAGRLQAVGCCHPRESSARKGFVARSRPSVVRPMCPGCTRVSSG